MSARQRAQPQRDHAPHLRPVCTLPPTTLSRRGIGPAFVREHPHLPLRGRSTPVSRDTLALMPPAHGTGAVRRSPDVAGSGQLQNGFRVGSGCSEFQLPDKEERPETSSRSVARFCILLVG
jgi:hypothetical protein